MQWFSDLFSLILNCELDVQQMKWRPKQPASFAMPDNSDGLARYSGVIQFKHKQHSTELYGKVLLLQSIIKRFYLYTIET